MGIVELYKVTVTKSYMMSEQRAGYDLNPWSGNNRDYEGYDDGGREYILPDGFEVSKSTHGQLFIYRGNDHCEISVHYTSGLPMILCGDIISAVLKLATPGQSLGRKGGSVKSERRPPPPGRTGKRAEDPERKNHDQLHHYPAGGGKDF